MPPTFARYAPLVALTGLLLSLPAAPLRAMPVAEADDTAILLARDTAETAGALTRHVVVVSIDGLRPDAIEAFRARTLQRLIDQGAWSLDAQTIFPSKTLPSHTSMLTGVEPEEHGITWNTDRTGEHGRVGVPTIFELADGAGLETAAFFSKAKFHHLERPGTLDYSQAPRTNHEHWLTTRTVADAVTYLRHRKPNLLFVHIGEPDYAGHSAGWMSRVYGWAVGRADRGLAALIEAAERSFGAGNYTVLVTADHGGHGNSHGTRDPRDMTIPWIAWGAGVTPGPIQSDIRTTDTAATALWLLGVGLPPAWTGQAVATAFTPPARFAGEGGKPARASLAVGAEASGSF